MLLLLQIYGLLKYIIFDGLDDDLRTGLVFYGRDHSADFLPFRGWDDILQTCFEQTGDVFNFLVDRTMTCWTRQL